MDAPHYLDFDLLIECIAGGKYRARVLNSPVGQAVTEFSVPFSDLELENFLLRVGRTRRGMRRIDSPEMESAKAFGGRLFGAVFDGEVRGCLRSSMDEANRQGLGLRIRMRLCDAPELAALPWEYLYNPALNRFLVLSTETPLIRYLELPERIQPLMVKPPLRILVMISSPSDYAALDVDREWEKLDQALNDLQQRGLVTLERLDTASLSALQRVLRKGQYHIFHFVGHGGFKEQTQDGVLVMEDDANRGHPVSGQDLGTLLHDHRSLRLVVLNACEGARSSRTDPFAGTAQNLIQQGIPAVIAMQFEVTDEAAISLSREFYGAVADGYPVDAALAEARKAIFAAGNDVEWGTPVLYLRAPDGRIFDVARLSEAESKPAQELGDKGAAGTVSPAQPRPELKPVPRIREEGVAPAAKTAPVPIVQAPPVAQARGSGWSWLAAIGFLALAAVCGLGALGVGLQLGGFFGGQATPVPLPVAGVTSEAYLPTWLTPTATFTPLANTGGVTPSTATFTPVANTPTPTPTAAAPTRTNTPVPPPQPEIVFEDRFEGSSLNSSKWVAANSVGISVANGSLKMASSSTRFPYIFNRANMFPTSGDFRLTVSFRYSSLGVCSAGILATSYDPSMLVGLSQDEAAKRQQAAEQNGVVAGIWQDSGSGFQFWYRSGAERPNIAISGQDTSSRVLTIEYHNNQYTTSLAGRGVIYTSQRTSNRPQYLWMGHPATIGSPCPWETLEVSDIKVESLP